MEIGSSLEVLASLDSGRGGWRDEGGEERWRERGDGGELGEEKKREDVGWLWTCEGGEEGGAVEIRKGSGGIGREGKLAEEVGHAESLYICFNKIT